MTARIPTPGKRPKSDYEQTPDGSPESGAERAQGQPTRRALSIRFARRTEDIRNLEGARAWCAADAAGIPSEVRALLESTPQMRGVKLSRGESQKGVLLDKSSREPRNADVALLGTDSRGRTIAITIEAKADEPFGTTFQQTVAASVERMVSGKPSNGLRQAEALARAILPPRRVGKAVPRADWTPSLGPLRYQLFTAVAGTLTFAHQSSAELAVFIIHESVTDCTRDEDHKANALDLDAFVSRLSDGAIRGLRSGEIVGPFPVAENAYWPSRPALYIGKVTKNIRNPQAKRVV